MFLGLGLLIVIIPAVESDRVYTGMGGWVKVRGGSGVVREGGWELWCRS